MELIIHNNFASKDHHKNLDTSEVICSLATSYDINDLKASGYLANKAFFSHTDGDQIEVLSNEEIPDKATLPLSNEPHQVTHFKISVADACMHEATNLIDFAKTELYGSILNTLFEDQFFTLKVVAVIKTVENKIEVVKNEIKLVNPFYKSSS